jgi:hypothetical protein
MKSKTILLLCLFMGIGTIQLLAQNPIPPGNKPGTGSVHFYENYDDISMDIPVICGGTEINHLVGSMVGFGRVFFKEGSPIFQNSWYKWEIVGNGGEKFKGQDTWKWNWEQFMGYGHINLIGDLGTHYILKYTWGDNGMEILEITCTGRK